MRIAVCDDEKIYFDELNQLFYEYSNMINDTICATYFKSGEALLSSQIEFDMVFMDYQMEGLDGLEAARILRTKNANIAIIFLTNYPQVVFRSFEVNTFRFLVKPVKKEELFAALNAYIKSVNNDDFLLIKTNDGTYKFRFSEIIYIEAQGKRSIIRTETESFDCSRYLKEIEKMLPTDRFMRTHKSCIVSFLHIRNHDNFNVCFDNGERGTISKRYLSNFKRAFQSYIIKYNSGSKNL